MHRALLTVIIGVAAAMSCATAANYDVGDGQQYPTLEELRQNGWPASGDTVTLHNDDSSLIDHWLYNGSKTLSFFGADGKLRTISGANAAAKNNPYGGILFFDGNVTNDNTLYLGNIRFEGGRVLATQVNQGLGGAILSDGNLTLNNASHVVFHDNQANAGNFANDNLITNLSMGGAIYAGGSLAMNGGVYTFTHNQVNAGNYTNRRSVQCGWGGAIIAQGALTMNDGVYNFTHNQANAASYNIGSTNNSGWGGAIHAAFGLTMNGGVYTFTHNQANGGSYNTGFSHGSSGLGGAIYASSTAIVMNDGVYTFTGNQANGGSYNTGTNGESGLGGAIHTYSSITMNNGVYTFTGNQANAGNYNNRDCFNTGSGGAIWCHTRVLGARLAMDNGDYTFMGNSASDGVGNAGEGKDEVSGLGGAIYIGGEFSMTDAMATFIGNSAVNRSGNVINGRGGAIFHDAREDDYQFTLGAGDGKAVLFKGNTQRQGEANSVYFGITDGSSAVTPVLSTRTTTASFAAGTDARLVMYDPIESQPDGLQGRPGYTNPATTYNSVIVDMTKDGAGIWSLGGVSNMYGASSLALNAGTFHQIDEHSRLVLHKKSTTATVNAAFDAKSGTIYRPAVNGHTGLSSKVVAPNSAVNADARFEVSGAATLTPGQTHSFTVIETLDSTTNPFVPLNADLLKATLTPDGNNYVLTVTAKALPNTYNLSENSLSGFFRMGGYLGNYDMQIALDDYYNGKVAAFPFTSAQMEDINLLAGDFAASAFDMSAQAGRAFSGTSMARILDVRRIAGLSSASPSPHSPNALASIYADPAAYMSDHRNRVWASGLGDWASMDKSKNMQGFDSRIYGAALGYDFAYANCLTAGIYGGYARLKSENDSDSARLEADNYYIGLYAGYDWNNIVMSATGYFGWSDNDTRHRYRAYNVSATGKYDSIHCGALLDVGYRLTPGGVLDLTPFAGLDWYHGKNDGYNESQHGDTAIHSTFARHIAKATYDSLQIPVGVRLEKTFALSNGTWVRPSLSLAYAREVADRSGKITARLIDHNTKWTARGTEPGRDVFRANASLTARICDRYDLGVEYGLELRKNYTDNRVKVSFGVSF